MKIKSIFDASFAQYGKVLGDYHFFGLLEKLERTTQKPEDEVIYVPSDATLESDDSFAVLRDNVFGGMPIQAGYCNGANTKLNALEYHRDSEVNVTADDIVLLLAREQDIKNGVLDTRCVAAFSVPKGTAVELFATTLHYAPCSGKKGTGFRVAVVLPRGTNTDKPAIQCVSAEDKLLFARNKWLIAHPASSEASQGAYVGLKGTNPDIINLLK